MLPRLKSRKGAASSRVGIDVQADGIALAFSQASGGQRRLTCKFLPFIDDNGGVAAALGGAVDKHGLKNCPLVYLMPPAEYSFLQTATPPMNHADMRAAARWKLGELIDYPVDSAVVDVFEVPESGQRGSERLLYAVAARSIDVQARVDEIRRTDLTLEAIDIGELALRNVIARLPENEEGVAVLCLAERSGVLVFIKQSELYLARRLEIGFDDLMLGEEQMYNDLVLELQRSLDFFESRFTQAPPSRLLIFPPDKFSGELILHINSHQRLEAEPLLLEKLTDYRVETDEESQARCLWAVGAALREPPEIPA